MNNKRKVASALILISISALLIACSEKPADDEVYRNAIDSLFSDKPANNIVFVTSRGVVMDNTVESGSIAVTITDKIDYQIKSVKSTDECSTASIAFTYPDMVNIINQYSSSDTDDDLFSWLTAELDGDYPQKQETIEVELTQDNNTYYLVIDEKLSNILTGGLIEYKMEAEKNAFAELSEE